MEIEEKLKELIMSRYKSMLEFTKAAGVPYGTVRSVFERGIMNSSVTTIMKICRFLGISTDDLVMGRIVFIDQDSSTADQTADIARTIKYCRQNVHEFNHYAIDGTKLSEREFERILDAIEVMAGLIRRDRENAE